MNLQVERVDLNFMARTLRWSVVVAAVAACSLGAPGCSCSASVSCNGLYAAGVTLTFPCNQLTDVDSTCASAEQALPASSPVQITLSPISPCPVTFHFRGGVAFSTNVLVTADQPLDLVIGGHFVGKAA